MSFIPRIGQLMRQIRLDLPVYWFFFKDFCYLVKDISFFIASRGLGFT